MHISNSYSLQRKMEKRKGLYEKTHDVSLVLKILFLLSIFGIVWNLWMISLTVVLLIADIILSIYRSKILFTYRYSFIDNVFYVIKVDLDGKECIVEQLSAEKIESVDFVEGENSDKKYFADFDDFGEDKQMRIVGDGKTFCILSDIYLYSILQYAMREKK